MNRDEIRHWFRKTNLQLRAMRDRDAKNPALIQPLGRAIGRGPGTSSRRQDPEA